MPPALLAPVAAAACMQEGSVGAWSSWPCLPAGQQAYPPCANMHPACPAAGAGRLPPGDCNPQGKSSSELLCIYRCLLAGHLLRCRCRAAVAACSCMAWQGKHPAAHLADGCPLPASMFFACRRAETSTSCNLWWASASLGSGRGAYFLLGSRIALPCTPQCWPNLPALKSRTSLLAIGCEPGPRPHHAGHRVHGGELFDE